MRIVDHDHCAVAFGQIAYGVEASEVAVHREDAVGGNHAQAFLGCRLESLFERRHVAVRIAVTLGLAKTYAVDDRRVVQGVGNDRVFFAEERFE